MQLNLTSVITSVHIVLVIILRSVSLNIRRKYYSVCFNSWFFLEFSNRWSAVRMQLHRNTWWNA